MSLRNKPLTVGDRFKNISATSKWSDGSARNAIFPKPERAHPWKLDANKENIRIRHRGRGFDPLSLYYAQIGGTTCPQVLTLFVPSTFLKSESLCTFVSGNCNAESMQKMLALMFECTQMQTVGPIKTLETHEENVGPVHLECILNNEPTRKVYLETVRNVTGSVVGFRYFFINREPNVTWGDMLFACVSQNNNRKSNNRVQRDWARLVHHNPHWGILNLADLATNMAMAVTNEMQTVSDIKNAVMSKTLLMVCAESPVNPVNVFSLKRALKPDFNTESHLTAGLHICPEQSIENNYTTINGDCYKFPVPSDVIELPSAMLSLQCLRRVLPPNLRMDPMELMVQEVMKNNQLALNMDNIFDHIQYLNTGRDIPVSTSVNDLDEIQINPGMYLTREQTVKGSEEYYERLAILNMERENRPAFYSLIDARNQPDMDEETYRRHIKNYHLSTFAKFERAMRVDNEMLTKAEQGALSHLFSHIDECKSKGVPIFNKDARFVQIDDDTDHTLEFEALFMTQFFKYFEHMGATRGHKDLVLMTCAAFESCSYDMTHDNIILINFGGAGVGKSWALSLFAEKLLIFDTVANYSHMTDMVGQTGGDSAGLITIVHEFSKRQMGYDERNPNSTGETHHKTQNDPRRCILAFFYDQETGERATITIKAFKKTSTLAATNDNKGQIPLPMLSRMIPLDSMPEKRFSASPHENCESHGHQTTYNEEMIGNRFKLLQCLVYKVCWMIHSKTIFLPHGINRFAAQAVMDQFKYNMRKNNVDIESPRFIRSLNRVYIIAEMLCVMVAVCMVQQELACETEFDLYLFKEHVSPYLRITEMQMRWALQLCLGEFLDPVEYPIMTAIASLTNYSKNPDASSNGRNIGNAMGSHQEIPTTSTNTASSSSSSGGDEWIHRRVQQREEEALNATGANDPVSARTHIPAVEYNTQRDGSVDYNTIVVHLQWNKFYAMIRDEVKALTGKELTNEQVRAVINKLMDKTHVCYNRIGHRICESDNEVRKNILRGDGANKILINAQYLDHAATEPIKMINKAITDITYKGQTYRSTVTCNPVEGCPWILPRVECQPCDAGFVMQTKNTKMPENPDYSNRSPFCQKLLMFDRMLFMYTGSVDDTVHMHHMISIGRKLETIDDWASFRLINHSQRKVEALAEKMYKDQNSTGFGDKTKAIQEARHLATQGTIVLQPMWPLPEIKKDYIRQALNMISRHREVNPTIQKTLNTMFKKAMQESGNEDWTQEVECNIFTIAHDKYRESQNSTGHKFLESHKRERDEDNDIFNLIMGGQTKFFKTLNERPIPAARIEAGPSNVSSTTTSTAGPSNVSTGTTSATTVTPMLITNTPQVFEELDDFMSFTQTY